MGCFNSYLFVKSSERNNDDASCWDYFRLADDPLEVEFACAVLRSCECARV